MTGWDRDVESWIVAHRIGFLNDPFRWLTYAGTQGAIWLVVALAVAVSTRRAQVLVAVAAADLVADVTTTGLQALFGRSRPLVATLVARPHSHSFPSGHAATSFACAVVLGALSPALRRTALGLAALIAFSRLYVGVHYPLDVLAGSAYGALVGLAVVRLVSSWTARGRSHAR